MAAGGRGRVRPLARVAAVATALALALGGAGCGGSGGSGAAAPSHRSTGPAPLDVEYRPGLHASVHLPDRPSPAGRTPVVLLVPGGSWQTSDPAGLADLAGYLADAGSVAAPVRVRAQQDGVRYPVPVEDVLCALAATAATARAHGVHPGPLVVLGHSSGAHLAALAALAVQDYSPACRAPAVRPDALVGLAGPYDVRQLPDVAQALFGSTPEQDPAAWAAGNPVLRAQLRPGVPALLVHGEDDEVVPTAFTTDLAARLREAGHHVTVQLVPGADHGSVYTSAVAGPLVVRWLAGLR